MYRQFSAAILAVAFLLAPALLGQYKLRRAPGFSLPDIEMKQHDLQDYRGKVVVVNIMRSTCPVCSQFSKNLSQVQQEFGDKLKVLSIVTPPDTQGTIRRYLADNELSSTVLFDCGQVAASYIQVTPDSTRMTVKIPHYYVIDTGGRIREDFEFNELNKSSFEVEAVKKLVAKYLPKAKVAEAR